MPTKLTCSGCEREFTVKFVGPGETARCPECHAYTVVPGQVGDGVVGPLPGNLAMLAPQSVAGKNVELTEEQRKAAGHLKDHEALIVGGIVLDLFYPNSD